MSFEIIEHQIKKNLERLKTGDAWFIPDALFDQALNCAYKQGCLDGSTYVSSLVDKACDSVARGETEERT